MLIQSSRLRKNYPFLFLLYSSRLCKPISPSQLPLRMKVRQQEVRLRINSWMHAGHSIEMSPAKIDYLSETEKRVIECVQ